MILHTTFHSFIWIKQQLLTFQLSNKLALHFIYILHCIVCVHIYVECMCVTLGVQAFETIHSKFLFVQISSVFNKGFHTLIP